MTRDLHVGLFGKDSRNGFEIIDTRDDEIKIRYIASGDVAWFQENRFEFTGHGLKLQ